MTTTANPVGKAFIVVTIGLFWLPSGLAEISVPRRPNVILILADDVGYADLGCYGGAAKTPHLDRLAAKGLRFTDFHSNGPMCSPTRAALLTGRYQQRTKVEIPGKILPQTELTIAQYLKSHGYTTGMFGKWHLGDIVENGPTKFGFSEFRGLKGDVDYQSHIDRDGKLDWWHNERTIREEGYVTELITEHAVRFIQAHRDVPFFIYLPHFAIHFPWMAPGDAPYRTAGTNYRLGLSKLGPHSPEAVPAVVIEMIESLDKGVGRVVKCLEELGLERETLIIFTSDNGGYRSYTGGFRDISNNGPLRGQKKESYEGGHRVPTIAYWPGRISPNITHATTISMDILPTILDIARLPPAPATGPNAVDGVSLKPLLLEGREPASRKLFWRMGAMARAVRSGQWKLQAIPGRKPELYDLSNDVGEVWDVAVRYPELVADLEESLKTWEEAVDR